MELKIGMVFKANPNCFRGTIEVLDINELKNELCVLLTLNGSKWVENWDLANVLMGFEIGEYLI